MLRFTPYTGPVVTRSEAKAAGLKRYFPNKPCVRGHVSDRWVDGGCTTCNAERKRDWRNTNPDIHRERAYAWRKNNYDRRLDTDREWNKQKRLLRPDIFKAYRLARKDKHAAACRAWYAANHSHQKQRNKAWRKANPGTQARWKKEHKTELTASKHKRRAKQRGSNGSFTKVDIQRIRQLQKDRCAWCRYHLRGGGHIDHIKPLSKGGSNWPRNLQLLCADCNLTKGASDPIDFARRNGMLL